MPDTTPPTISLTANKTTLKHGETALITFTLSEVALNFALSDITFTGGTITNFSGSGKEYSATFTPNQNSNSSGSVSVGNFKFSDIFGNTNQDGADANNIVNFVIDTLSPPSFYLTIDRFVGGLGGAGRVIAGSQINEGGLASFTLHATNIAAGTVIPFTISGLTANDISLVELSDMSNGLITGNVTVEKSFWYQDELTANISITTIADGLTDGDKTLTVTVNGTSASVVVYDTSTDLSNRKYYIDISALYHYIPF